MSAIIVQQPQAIADTRERDRLTANLILKNATNDQQRLVLAVCDRYGFDPLLRHVLLISGSLYVTRDGLLHAAHASGKFGGFSRPEYERNETTGKWTVTLAVYRTDMPDHPFWATAYQEEHEQQTPPWKKAPSKMTLKCAEVLALKRAFDVSLGTAEEVGYDPTSDITAAGRVSFVAETPAPDPNRAAYVAAHDAIRSLIDGGAVPRAVITRLSAERFDGRLYRDLTGPERVELLAAIRDIPQPELDGEEVIDALFEDRAPAPAA